ncbi:DUF6817 domain-containing protein [Streptomyces nojiriensis]|uniref:DUF6817 domain-containing protein n=1 Tax=Streptomyces nojiriensis TaxID=66374 RepID=UPI0035DAA605
MSTPASRSRTEILDWLSSLGAGQHTHHGRPLLEHLLGTEKVLQSWRARPALATAGLCHAIYGTDGLAQPLLPLTDRHLAQQVLGDDAERIIYRYASCDRTHLHAQLPSVGPLQLRDRFTGAIETPAAEHVEDFMELTWANAVDGSGVFDEDLAGPVLALFAATASWVSDAAKDSALGFS